MSEPLIYMKISISYMAHKPTSTARARRLRERRSRGVVMVAPVEIGEGGVALLVGNGLLEQHQADDRNAVGAACVAALEQWTNALGSHPLRPGLRCRVYFLCLAQLWHNAVTDNFKIGLNYP